MRHSLCLGARRLDGVQELAQCRGVVTSHLVDELGEQSGYVGADVDLRLLAEQRERLLGVAHGVGSLLGRQRVIEQQSGADTTGTCVTIRQQRFYNRPETTRKLRGNIVL